MTHFRRQHKPQLPPVDFLVAAHESQELISVVVRRGGGELERLEQRKLSAHELAVDAAHGFRQTGSAHHADRDRFAVQEFAVVAGGLEGVGKGVAVVEHGTQARGFAFVVFDDFGFESAAALDKVPQGGADLSC